MITERGPVTALAQFSDFLVAAQVLAWWGSVSGDTVDVTFLGMQKPSPGPPRLAPFLSLLWDLEGFTLTAFS